MPLVLGGGTVFFAVLHLVQHEFLLLIVVVSTINDTLKISGTVLDPYIADNEKSLTNRLKCCGGCLAPT